jgi:GNAT superfamily N-acetyltransferase
MRRRAPGRAQAELPLIVPMPRTPLGVQAATACVVDGGWGTYRQFHPTFAFYASHRGCRALIARVAGDVVGTAVATRYGRSGWIGHVFVRPDFRGHGLGSTLTSAALAHLRAAGCESIFLASTDAGRHLYERLGFVVESNYHELRGRSLPKNAELGPFRPLLRSDLHPLSRADLAITGDDRSAVLARLANFAWGLTRGESILGAVLPVPWGGAAAWLGPTATSAEEAALVRLLRTLGSVGDEVIVYPPDENRHALDLFRDQGFEELRLVPRMRLGKPLAWSAAATWNPLSLGLG